MDEPAWVTLLFDRSRGNWRHPGNSLPGPQDVSYLSEYVQGFTNGEPEKAEQLRSAALRRLDDDPFCSLMFLSIVGTSDELPLIEPFFSSTKPAISAAAKICRFELRAKRTPT